MSKRVGSMMLHSPETKFSLSKRKFGSKDSTDDPWGWFEDFDNPVMIGNIDGPLGVRSNSEPLKRSLSLPPPASSPPMYVLESSLDTQHLWYVTAGQRPKQPDHERAYFERLWARNFEMSSVSYDANGLTIPGPENKMKKNVDKMPKDEIDGEILLRGKGPFSNSVSKSFLYHDLASLTLQIPRFRVIREKNGSVHAEFLVVVSLGNKNSITFGIWRRHSDFNNLAMMVKAENAKTGAFKNTMLSWQCVLQRKRWFRCLDKDYLSLKSFLIERFMHDLLFESVTPDMINDFLGLD